MQTAAFGMHQNLSRVFLLQHPQRVKMVSGIPMIGLIVVDIIMAICVFFRDLGKLNFPCRFQNLRRRLSCNVAIRSCSPRSDCASSDKICRISSGKAHSAPPAREVWDSYRHCIERRIAPLYLPPSQTAPPPPCFHPGTGFPHNHHPSNFSLVPGSTVRTFSANPSLPPAWLSISPQAVEVLKQQKAKTNDTYVFPSPNGGPISPDTYAHVATSAQKEAAQTMGNVLSV